MSSFREIAHGLSFPEGPVSLPDGSLLVVEIAAGRLTKINLDGKKTLVTQLKGGPNGAAIGPDGRPAVTEPARPGSQQFLWSRWVIE